MLNPPNYKPWRRHGPTSPIKSANFMPNASAGRLIYNADHRVKTDMRIRMQERTHAYRHALHKRLREAEEGKEEQEQEITQLQILEEYAATVEGALNLESQAPFQYGGPAMQDALSKIQARLVQPFIEKIRNEVLAGGRELRQMTPLSISHALAGQHYNLWVM
jgi:hypothetical protein